MPVSLIQTILYTVKDLILAQKRGFVNFQNPIYLWNGNAFLVLKTRLGFSEKYKWRKLACRTRLLSGNNIVTFH